MGGHVFKGSTPIRKRNIQPTLKKFVDELNRVFEGKVWISYDIPELLGSAGKKEISGDIDLAISDDVLIEMVKDFPQDKIDELKEKFTKRARTATKEQIIKRTYITLLSQYINNNSDLIITTDKGASNGTLFCQFPQYNEEFNDLDYEVQIDINFGKVEWLQFAYKSDIYIEENIKGLHRTQLMIALFTNKGYTFSHNYGVKNKETQKIVAHTPQKAIELLNKEYNFGITKNILSNYIKLNEYILSHVSLNEVYKIYDLYLKVLDSTRCDIPMDIQWYWIENKERLGLTGKFLPEISKLKNLIK